MHTLSQFLIDRIKQKANGKSDSEKRTKVVVRCIKMAMYNQFSLWECEFLTAKERLKEEVHNMLSDDKNKFFVKTVHVNRAATDAAHKMLRKKFGKMDKAAMKVFETL